MANMNVNLLITKDYRKNDCLAPQKTNLVLSEVEWANSNPIKPKQRLPCLSLTKPVLSVTEG